MEILRTLNVEELLSVQYSNKLSDLESTYTCLLIIKKTEEKLLPFIPIIMIVGVAKEIIDLIMKTDYHK